MSDEPTTTSAEPTGEPETQPTAPAQEPSTTHPDKPADEPKGDTDWKAKARQWEDRAKENKKALDQAAKDQQATKAALDKFAVALGLKKGDDVDPQKLAEQLTAERDKAAQDAQDARTELAVFRMADKHKADPGALLDSREFKRDVDALDPSSKDFDTDLAELIKQRVKDNPNRFGREAVKAPPKKSGPDDMTGDAGRQPGKRPTSLHAAIAARNKT